MARRRRNRKQLDTTPQDINIDSLAHDGRGVGRGEDELHCMLNNG